MSQLNFEAMSQANLRAYMISHPDDQEGFYALVDRFHADPRPKLNSLEDLDELPEVQRAKQRAK